MLSNAAGESATNRRRKSVASESGVGAPVLGAACIGEGRGCAQLSDNAAAAAMTTAHVCDGTTYLHSARIIWAPQEGDT
jgi:hypothetical protein